MPHMPDKPDTWVIVLAWLSQHSPTIYAGSLSFVMATLSVQLDAAATGCDGVQAATSTGCVVHGARRAQLDPAHAQRIVRITGDGDQGLIALQACQAYAKEVSDMK